ncbi:MAG: hypothetical protein KAI66_25625, partial [Lentisphaeria bacterium]|nr:hypothetical protein [Lentisphaeria bacterium]
MAFRHIQKQGDSELPAVPYGQCIAKTCEDGAPGLTVSEHCRIVGEVARRLTSLLPPDVASSLGNTVLTAALHDVGKVSPGFQLKYFPEHAAHICRELADVPNHFEKDHARTGGSAVWQAIGSPWHCPVTAWVAATHHGSVSRSPSPTDTAFEYGGEHWSLQRTELIEALKSEFGELDDRKLSLA